MLQGNIFKHNSGHANKPIVEISSYNDVDPEYLNGEYKRSMIMLNNTFEENGSHG